MVRRPTRFRGSNEPSRLDWVLVKNDDLVEINTADPLGDSDHITVNIEVKLADEKEVNRWLEEYRRVRGIGFLSVWDRFYGDRKMYKRDLLHPCGRGAWALGKEYDRVVCEVQGEFVGSMSPLN